MMKEEEEFIKTALVGFGKALIQLVIENCKYEEPLSTP
jgi:hypothetical protein